MSIYVEILIRAPIETLWNHTQTPELHQRWDLRFSRIEYLPEVHDGEPQRFRYRTRIGFGVEIAGDGESTGERDREDGSRTSALTFRSADRRSIIREGSGYWKYIPTPDGIRFLTWYDYQTRFGPVGVVIDRIIFRPLMAWATAWSFDRLRLWLERDLAPDHAVRDAWVHGVARTALAFIFAYHGLVPKLLGPHIDEVVLVQDAGIAASSATIAINALGLGEVLLALVLLVWWRRSWPPMFCFLGMIVATVGVAVSSPQFLGAAFNPVSLNVAVACLALIDMTAVRTAPSAGRCRRRPPKR